MDRGSVTGAVSWISLPISHMPSAARDFTVDREAGAAVTIGLGGAIGES